MEAAGQVNKGETLREDKAAEQTADTGASETPRRGLRERGAGRSKSASSTDINGAASSSLTSGRVLRDRSTRAVPAWLKDSKSDDDEEEDEASPDNGAAKRRKVSNSRRKKNSETASLVESGGEITGESLQATDLENHKKRATDAPAAACRRLPPVGRSVRANAKPVCKTEPEMENPAAEEGTKNNKTYNIGKEEDEIEEAPEQILDDDDDDEAEEEEHPFPKDPNDPDFQSQSPIGEEEEESISTDEDLPFKDDLNDQSYDPREERFANRDGPKPKRRLPPRQKEKDKTPKKEKESSEIKVEGSDNVESAQEEIKLEEEVLEDPDGPRKRGRRKKDDKTPRLPKRRKKPPVQYVRCEIEGCGTVLAHPRYLQHHIKYQHLLKKKYVCPHPSCGRLFRLQKQLLRHAKHHTDQRDYICEFCARAFKSSHNLAVHRMIHTGEKPLQCEICGFTCRQKASLNWHMKKHDADATYQFSCSICGKKFEKKDCVVAHKAKSHPEVLIAEALAANAGALITTPASLLEGNGGGYPAKPGVEVVHVDAEEQEPQHAASQMSHQVVLLGQDQSLHAMQVPVTIALSPIDPPSPADNQTHLQLQMPVQFVQTSQQQQSQILQMTFQPVGQSQIPILAAAHQPLLPASTNGENNFILDNPTLSSPPGGALQQAEVVGGGGAAGWEHGGVLADAPEAHVHQQGLM